MSFSKDNRPILMGAYFNEDAVVPTTVAPNAGSVVAVPFTHNWGPFKAATLLTSFAQFEQVYGKDASQARTAVYGAFYGEGVPGFGGAGGVLAYRTGGSTAAKATKTLSNTTPAAALVLSAKYEGTKGNNLRVTVQDLASDSTQTELILLDNNANELERYRFADANLASAASQINASSNWITASVTTDGVVLAVVSNQAFTAGDDGSSLSGADVTAVQTALEIQRFGVFAPADIAGTTYTGGATATSILASYLTWAQGLNVAGKRFMSVIGGASGESLTTANARTATMNDSDWVNVGMGTFTDSNLNLTLSSSQLAPRIAGIIAQRGEARGLSASRLQGVSITTGATEAEKVTAFKAGTWVIGRDSNAVAPTRLERAVTTYTTTNNTSKPYLIYRNPKFVRTMHGIENEFKEWIEANVLGKLPVNDKTRDSVRTEFLSRLNSRAAATAIQPNPTVAVDTDPPPSDNDEFLAFVYGVRFGRSAEQVFGTLRVA